MAVDEVLWNAIQSGVRALPKPVEWYAPSELEKKKNGQPAASRGQYVKEFYVPSELVDLMGGETLIAKCQEFAASAGCDFYVAFDNSLRFIKHA
jgi:hypothetical protein